MLFATSKNLRNIQVIGFKQEQRMSMGYVNPPLYVLENLLSDLRRVLYISYSVDFVCFSIDYGDCEALWKREEQKNSRFFLCTLNQKRNTYENNHTR